MIVNPLRQGLNGLPDCLFGNLLSFNNDNINRTKLKITCSICKNSSILSLVLHKKHYIIEQRDIIYRILQLNQYFEG